MKWVVRTYTSHDRIIAKSRLKVALGCDVCAVPFFMGTSANKMSTYNVILNNKALNAPNDIEKVTLHCLLVSIYKKEMEHAATVFRNIMNSS